jgi:ribosomal protein S27E
MKALSLRKKKFYGAAMRSFFVLLALVLLLAILPQVDMLQNQKITMNKTIITGVEVAKVLVSLIIIGALMTFAYISESQLPHIATRVPQSGLIISSVIHIVVISIAYFYLLPFAKDRLGNVNQIFNAIFLIILCVPLVRGGVAFYKGVDGLAGSVVNSSFDSSATKCEVCGTVNESTAKRCQECGNKLPIFDVASQHIVCKDCGAQNKPSAKQCVECGNKLQETITKTISCPQCNTENKLGAKHCSECGFDLTKVNAT